MNIQPYIILNNIDSRTISGLLISSLAPISKPQVRTQIETIDGRSGDIVTPLGYRVKGGKTAKNEKIAERALEKISEIKASMQGDAIAQNQ